MNHLAVCVLTLGIALTATPGWAAEPDDKGQAAELYTRASELTRAGRCDEAMPLLERSYALLESPNTALLLARCLRDVDRVEASYVRYEVALHQAEERVARGELRFAATATAARDEMAAVARKTGVLVIGPLDAGDRIEVYGLRASPRADRRAHVRIRAGSTRIAILRAGGGVEERTVSIAAERRTDVVLEAPGPTEERATVLPLSPPPRDAQKPSWMLPTALGSLAVGALGFGTFAFFGLRSESTYDDLRSCAPACALDRRDDADRGARDQTIANVGLAVGIVALAAGGTLLIVQAAHRAR